MRALRTTTFAGGSVAIALLLAISWNRPPTVHQVPVKPGDSSHRCMPNGANNYCAPTNDPRVADAVASLHARGMRCTSRPSLTDHIVFQYRGDERVEVLTFDEAFDLGKRNAGWVQSYCVKQ